jgi:hypothetical protein
VSLQEWGDRKRKRRCDMELAKDWRGGKGAFFFMSLELGFRNANAPNTARAVTNVKHEGQHKVSGVFLVYMKVLKQRLEIGTEDKY